MFLTTIGQPRCVIYARVSSSRQEQAGNLERQTDRLRQVANTRGYLLVETIAEQASSLNEKRRGMKKLFSLIEKEAVDVVLIEYADRLVRFGFPYLLQAFAWQGVRLEVLEEPEKQEPLAEMTADQARHRYRVLWAHVRASSKTCASVYDESD